ncbi:MAG TPA: Wzz/FepE/Etk N-terminal domain-containing protein [Streptosporangiaceae bacterium]|jgi:Mrp family chromosome partitioning ATPase
MDVQQSGTMELSDYAAMIRRRGWVIAVGVAVGLALAGIALVVFPKHYTAEASVQVTKTGAEAIGGSGNADARTNGGINLDTEAQLVRSADVVGRAEQLMRVRIPMEDILQNIQVTVPPNTSVLTISYEGSSARGAQAGAHAFAQAYLDSRKANAQSQINSAVGSINRQLAGLRDDLRQWSGRVASLPRNSSDLSFAEVQRDLVKGRIEDLNKQLSPLTSATVTPGRIIADAELPDSPSSPLPLVFLGGGLLAGLLVGLVVAFIRDRSDKYIRYSRDIERALEIPVLLDVPAKGGRLGLLTARSRIGQSFHELCHSLTATLGHGGHVILVTGAAPGMGGNVVAANLAAALARTETGVLLVCADLHSPVAQNVLGLYDGPGLAEALLDRAEPGDVEQRAGEIPSLRVVPPGHEGELAADLLQREAMAKMIARLRRSCRYLVIEAPSTSAGADAQALADLADAAVIVVEMPKTRYDQVRDAARQLDRMGAAVIGAVAVPDQGRPAVLRTRPMPQSAPVPDHRRPPARAALPPANGHSRPQGAPDRLVAAARDENEADTSTWRTVDADSEEPEEEGYADSYGASDAYSSGDAYGSGESYGPADPYASGDPYRPDAPYGQGRPDAFGPDDGFHSNGSAFDNRGRQR